MQTCQQFDSFPERTQPVVLAVGNFDGLHRGHVAVIRQAEALAARLNARTWVMCFQPHPARILRPARAPRLLMSPGQRATCLAALGVDGFFEASFNEELSRLSPEAFVELLRSSLPTLAGIVVGDNWRFGHKAAGHVDTLQHLLSPEGIEVCVAEVLLYQERPISSTRIREALRKGELALAEQLLGHPYPVVGQVRHGKKLGRELGYPTANLYPENEVLPPGGVYAVRVKTGEGRFGGAAYLPAVSEEPDRDRRLLEVNLLDARVDLYEQEIEVTFLDFIRSDRRFETHEALQEQIGKDVARIREVLAR